MRTGSLGVFAIALAMSLPTAFAQRPGDGQPQGFRNVPNFRNHIQLSPGPVIHFSPSTHIGIMHYGPQNPPRGIPRYRPIYSPPNINNRPFYNPPNIWNNGQPYFWHPYHPFYGWNNDWYPLGSFFTDLAATAILAGTIDAASSDGSDNAIKVYYDNGNFYEKDGSKYRVIEAPIGMKVPTIPASATECIVGSTVYHYYEGVFYKYEVGGFTVVRAPVGAIVYNLPPGASESTINGQVYYNLNGVFYMPTSYNNEAAFEVAQI